MKAETAIALCAISVIALLVIFLIITFVNASRRRNLKNELCQKIKESHDRKSWPLAATINKMSLRLINSIKGTLGSHFSKIINEWDPASVVSFIREIEKNVKKESKRNYLLGLLPKLFKRLTEERLADILIESLIISNEETQELIMTTLTYDKHDQDQFLLILEKKLKKTIQEDRCQNIRATIEIEAQRLMERIKLLINDLSHTNE